MDIGSSTVANGVLGLVIGVITSLVVEMAFLVQVTNGHNVYRFCFKVVGVIVIMYTNKSSLVLAGKCTGRIAREAYRCGSGFAYRTLFSYSSKSGVRLII